MNYITVKEAAEKWNLSVRCIQNYCMNEKIPGTKNIGKQWMIPSDAEPPSDGRTKSAKESPAKYCYRFPLLVYTRYYRDTAELSDDEIKLLKAQKLHFEGKFSESIAICSTLLNENLPNHLRIAVHFTIGFNAALLALHLEYKKAVENIKLLTENEDKHKEDMKILLATLIYHTSWDFELFKKINPEALSEEALPIYKYNLVTKNIFSGSIDNETTYRYIQSDLSYLKANEITPLLLNYHCLLGGGNYALTHTKLCEHHFREAVRIAVEQGWISKLSKFYALNVNVIDSMLLEYGKSYVEKLKELRAVTTRNWQITHQLETGTTINSDLNDEKTEYLLLVIYNLSYEQIASIKQLPVSNIKRIYKELIKICNVKNKKELVNYAFELFKSLAPDVSDE